MVGHFFVVVVCECLHLYFSNSNGDVNEGGGGCASGVEVEAI